MSVHHTVPVEEAHEPFVLAVDIGSTASRAGVYDATGRPLAGRRYKVLHAFTTGSDGTSTIDPDQVVEEVGELLTALAKRNKPGRIGGVALDTFASSLVGVDAEGAAVTPCYTYADSRCAAQVAELRSELDEVAVQQRTGCRLHTSYLPARLRWLRDTDPGTFARVRRWMSLGEYVYLRLLGTTAVGTAAAAWSGLLDRHTGRWDPEMVAAAGIDVAQLSEVRDPDQPLTASEVSADVAATWPSLSGAAWYGVIADGVASNVGTGVVDPATVAVAAATSGAARVLVDTVPPHVPLGLWCYRVDSGRSLLGGALNDVGRVASWLQATLRLPDGALDELLRAEPHPATPVVLPFLTGERSIGWVGDARAVLTGVSVATTPEMLARGAMEGVAIAYARVLGQLAEVAGVPDQLRASGRVTVDTPGLLQLLADVVGAPVQRMEIKRATLRGTALIALDHLAPHVPRTSPPVAETFLPVPGRETYYAGRRAAFEDLYARVVAH